VCPSVHIRSFRDPYGSPSLIIARVIRAKRRARVGPPDFVGVGDDTTVLS
jgi:hypothetical protein